MYVALYYLIFKFKKILNSTKWTVFQETTSGPKFTREEGKCKSPSHERK